MAELRFGLGRHRADASKAVRKRSRKVFIGQTGALGPGRRPSCQPHPEILSSTARSWATIVIGTSRLGSWPVTSGAGWWSPRNISTRLLLLSVSTKEKRLFNEYSIEFRYAVRTRPGLRHTTSGRSPAAAIGPKTEPSPTFFQSISPEGRGAQGAWLVTRGISAISGAWPGVARSKRWKADRVYWSGGVPQLKRGPR